MNFFQKLLRSKHGPIFSEAAWRATTFITSAETPGRKSTITRGMQPQDQGQDLGLV
jgi:hypothetical protein